MEEHLNSNNSPYKFNGKELDDETGNYYYGARYYDPKFSMWLSVDPLASKYPSWSPYNYTMDNPVNLVDPNGRRPVWHWNAIGFLVADKGDNAKTLAEFLGTNESGAKNILSRTGLSNEKINGGECILNQDLYVNGKSNSGPVVENTREAVKHYYNGKGKAADVGDKSFHQILNTKKFKSLNQKIRNENVVSEGYFAIDMTDLTFHIGNTQVNYSIENNDNSSSVRYRFFTNQKYGTDGFWDPDFIDEKVMGNWLGIDSYKPDGPGLNLERGGDPYHYKSRERTYFFKPLQN